MIYNFSITVLSENNSAWPDFHTEEGLSLLIKADDKTILFDTGQSDIFLKNAEILSENIDIVDTVVLSHSHFDHTSGLHHLNNKTVYIHKNFFTPQFYLENKNYKYIGNPFTKKYYEKKCALKFQELNNDISQKIAKDVYLIAGSGKYPANQNFFTKQNNRFKAAPFNDELTLWLNTRFGVVIVTGCAHSGIINIIDAILNKIPPEFPKNIYAIIGGFHISELSQEEQKKILTKLKNYQTEYIGISHCTGIELPEEVLDDRFFDFNVGDEFPKLLYEDSYSDYDDDDDSDDNLNPN